MHIPNLGGYFDWNMSLIGAVRCWIQWCRPRVSNNRMAGWPFGQGQCEQRRGDAIAWEWRGWTQRVVCKIAFFDGLIYYTIREHTATRTHIPEKDVRKRMYVFVHCPPHGKRTTCWKHFVLFFVMEGCDKVCVHYIPSTESNHSSSFPEDGLLLGGGPFLGTATTGAAGPFAFLDAGGGRRTLAPLDGASAALATIFVAVGDDNEVGVLDNRDEPWVVV